MLQLLGETTLLGEQPRRSVAAFERAIALRADDLQITTGLVDAYNANGQYSKAVDYLLGLRSRVPSISALGAAAAPGIAQVQDSSIAASATGSSSSSSEEAPSSPAVTPSSTGSVPTASEEAAGSRSKENRPIRPLDPVSVELLLAKTYSQWRGHDNDALATWVHHSCGELPDMQGTQTCPACANLIAGTMPSLPASQRTSVDTWQRACS